MIVICDVVLHQLPDMLYGVQVRGVWCPCNWRDVSLPKLIQSLACLMRRGVVLHQLYMWMTRNHAVDKRYYPLTVSFGSYTTPLLLPNQGRAFFAPKKGAPKHPSNFLPNVTYDTCSVKVFIYLDDRLRLGISSFRQSRQYSLSS